MVPVDDCVRALVSLSLGAGVDGSASVFHIRNPHKTSLDAMRQGFESFGVAIDTSLDYRGWVGRLRADEGNPLAAGTPRPGLYIHG